MTERRQFLQTAVACATGLIAPMAFGQSAPWPSKPINYLVAFPAGGGGLRRSSSGWFSIGK
jgi:tripartite-type tricarboxylate transporter receptor subunit TctC